MSRRSRAINSQAQWMVGGGRVGWLVGWFVNGLAPFSIRHAIHVRRWGFRRSVRVRLQFPFFTAAHCTYFARKLWPGTLFKRRRRRRPSSQTYFHHQKPTSDRPTKQQIRPNNETTVYSFIQGRRYILLHSHPPIVADSLTDLLVLSDPCNSLQQQK